MLQLLRESLCLIICAFDVIFQITNKLLHGCYKVPERSTAPAIPQATQQTDGISSCAVYGDPTYMLLSLCHNPHRAHRAHKNPSKNFFTKSLQPAAQDEQQTCTAASRHRSTLVSLYS